MLYGDRYELLSLVGAGAYGSVYRARDSELDEVVAVKVLRREHLSQADALPRFRREVRLARRVAHPNVARTFDIGRHQGERFLTMEFINGQPLTRYCPIGAPVSELLPIRLVLDVARELCAGLGALHAAGIVHHDMKTDNVLVGKDARVVITDFGIARVLTESEAEMNAAVPITGTPAYMAPEQVRGYGRIDTRADLYSLGVMLFQMLTGQLPFDGATGMAMALARLYESPADPRKLRAQLPRSLCEILFRCLAREPDARFQTADELAAALSAERPAGPDLLDYLQAAVTLPRSDPALNPTVRLNSTAAEPAATIAGASSPPRPPLEALPDSRKLTVAVLLFRHAAADEYLAHGLTAEIIDRLSESEGLRVTSFGVVSCLPTEAREPGIVGGQLQVKVVLDGTLRRSSEGLQATVRLIDVDSRLQFAVRRFERQDHNILALAIEVAQNIGELLTVKLDQSQGELVGDMVAVDLYVQARHQYTRMTPGAVAESIKLYKRALERLPNESALLTGYAMALARAWFFGGEGAEALVMQASERAVQAAPDSGEAYLALANAHLNAARSAETATALRRALAWAPRMAEAHEFVGHLLAETGPIDAAVRHLNYAMMLDPSIPRVHITLARIYILDGRREAAEALLQIHNVQPSAMFIQWIALSRMLTWVQDVEGAKKFLLEPIVRTAPFAEVYLRLQHLAGERHVSAEEYLPSFCRSGAASPRSLQFGHQVLTEYHMLCRNYDEALRELSRSADLGLADVVWLDCCQLLAPLRDLAGYAEQYARVAEQAQRTRQALGFHNA